jgi:hypothetical protein
MRPVFVDQHLAQCRPKTTGLRVGQVGTVTARQFNLNDLRATSTKVQGRALAIAVSAPDLKVVPTEAAQQRGGRNPRSGPAHVWVPFLIIRSHCVPAVAIAWRNIKVGGVLGGRRCEPV